MRSDDVDLLASVVAVADVVLAPRPNVSVPPETVQGLRDRVRARHDGACLQAQADRIVGDEVLMLAQAMTNCVLYGIDSEVSRAVRWQMIVQHLLPWVRTDLAILIGEGRDVRS